ncbi:MAG TPA: hypothetical protein VH044_15150 [Polyangiaceae bacterium]|nr:hypothetical protein [Polyangiaceae bacterium]
MRKTFALTAISAVVAMGFHEETASARTVFAAGGYPYQGSTVTGFYFNSGGILYYPSAGSATWVIPLTLDTFGAKNVIVRGEVFSGGSLQCLAAALTTTGSIASVSGMTTFPVTSGITFVTLSVPTVPASAQAFVQCIFSGSPGNAGLLGIEYTP